MATQKIYSLIPLESFKEVLSFDDRNDPLIRYCLITATHTIEQHCMRRILRKRHFEKIEYTGDLQFALREYPVKEVLAVYALSSNSDKDGELLENDFYTLSPVEETDVPYSIFLSPAFKNYHHIDVFSVVYWAGYTSAKIPPDLASACLELATWNMNRYKGKQIGLTGSVRGGAKGGEHFELSMPENVRSLLEPYKRRVI